MLQSNADLDDFRGSYPTEKIIQQKEAEARMIADKKDRNALKRTLQLSTNPFDMTLHDPSVLMNIYTFTNQLKLGISK